MKINVIKKLAENEKIEDLEKVEEEIYDEKETLSLDIEGVDMGEKLTHVIAAIWVKKEMKDSGIELKDAVRKYTQKVRNSIS